MILSKGTLPLVLDNGGGADFRHYLNKLRKHGLIPL